MMGDGSGRLRLVFSKPMRFVSSHLSGCAAAVNQVEGEPVGDVLSRAIGPIC